jgi:hypothetical protein
MLDLIKLIRNELLADSTITAYVGSRIHMEGALVGNTENDYPQITIEVSDGPTDSLTDDYYPDLRINIWTKGSECRTTAGLIAKQILLNIDKKSYLTNDPIVYQLWKSNNIPIWEDDTKVFHRVLTFDVVMAGHGGNL